MARPHRRAQTAEALRESLITALRDAFPDRQDGLAIVAWSQARRHRRPTKLHLTTVHSPDNSGGRCIWESGRANSPNPLPRTALRSINKTLVSLDRLQAFDAFRGDWFEWMKEEHDAFPGLLRLIVTITPPVPAACLPQPYPWTGEPPF